MALPRINNAAKMTPSWCCRNSAAGNAPSWARVAKFAASMVNICQTYSKYGSPSHTWRISGSATKFSQFRQHWQHGQFRQLNKRRGQARKPYDERHFSPATKTLSSCGMDILWYGYARQRGVLTSSKDRRKVLPCVIPRGQCCVAFRICKTARR